MQHSSIEQIDRAALVLLQALGEHRAALAGHFEPGHLEGLEADLNTLRQALLGLQMGALYWDAEGGEVEQGVGRTPGRRADCRMVPGVLRIAGPGPDRSAVSSGDRVRDCGWPVSEFGMLPPEWNARNASV